MEAKYSKKIVSKIFKNKDGSEVAYKANKLGNRTVFVEGLTIMKTIVPSIGSVIDAFQNQKKIDELDPVFNISTSSTFATAFQYLSENLGVEYLDELVGKLMGKLYIGDTLIQDVDDHFDEHPEHFLDVLWWLIRENFENFIMENDMSASLISQVSTLLAPEMKAKLIALKDSMNDTEQDSKEQ